MAYRIGIVNDLALAREALVRTVALVPDGAVAWIAKDGDEAVAKCAVDVPDLVLMDLVMPRMAGIEATRRIMRESPCPVLVVTATVEGNPVGVYDAIGAGAIDAVDTPRLDAAGKPQAERILEKVASIRAMVQAVARDAAEASVRGAPAHARAPSPPVARPAVQLPPDGGRRVPLLLVGASTGGPQAVADLVAALAAGTDSPLRRTAVVIVQHMDSRFVSGFIEWLSSHTGVAAKALKPGSQPRMGDVLIAGGDAHAVIGPSGAFAAMPARPQDLHTPSVDALFSSAARAIPAGGAAALLTGMGRDGAQGLRELRQAGWSTFAQDRDSSVVWGMPGAALSLGAVDRCMSIKGMAEAIRGALTQR